jgi:hypothetical protein
MAYFASDYNAVFIKTIFILIDGLYLTAFCDALNSTVLTNYRNKISELENCLLKDHFLNVTFLQTHLENVNI